VRHVPQDAIGVVDDLPRTFPFDVRDEAHAAAIVLESGIVQAVGARCGGARLASG
jgi:hypothetical protein